MASLSTLLFKTVDNSQRNRQANLRTLGISGTYRELTWPHKHANTLPDTLGHSDSVRFALPWSASRQLIHYTSESQTASPRLTCLSQSRRHAVGYDVENGHDPVPRPSDVPRALLHHRSPSLEPASQSTPRPLPGRFKQYSGTFTVQNAADPVKRPDRAFIRPLASLYHCIPVSFF